MIKHDGTTYRNPHHWWLKTPDEIVTEINSLNQRLNDVLDILLLIALEQVRRDRGQSPLDLAGIPR